MRAPDLVASGQLYHPLLPYISTEYIANLGLTVVVPQNKINVATGDPRSVASRLGVAEVSENDKPITSANMIVDQTEYLVVMVYDILELWAGRLDQPSVTKMQVCREVDHFQGQSSPATVQAE